jgi:hypothetical protein
MKSILDVREVGKYNAGHILGKLKIYELLGQQETGFMKENVLGKRIS